MQLTIDPSEKNNYHVLIVGGGPAAVSAAIYCHRFDYKVIMIGQEYGGAISKTYLIENYPGFYDISGFDLMDKFQKHYEHFNIPFEYDMVDSVEKAEDGHFIIKTAGDQTYHALAVLVTTGGNPRKLNIPGEEEFHGRGVSYCATCDGPFFRNKDIVVVGGSDSAVVEAIFLAKFGKKVSIVYRREKVRSEPINTERAETNPRIEIINNTTLKSINGSDRVESVIFHDGTVFPTSAVFIEIGSIPNTSMVNNLGVNFNEKGEIVVDKYAQTNVSGVFAAGDVTDIREKQVITACGQAVTATYSIRDFLKEKYEI
ncbi:MAG: NAD(P)/FAD-dependent oxidoreductase [Promethearchaeota archaeon]